MTAKNGSDVVLRSLRVQGRTCGEVMVGAAGDTAREVIVSVGMG